MCALSITAAVSTVSLATSLKPDLTSPHHCALLPLRSNDRSTRLFAQPACSLVELAGCFIFVPKHALTTQNTRFHVSNGDGECPVTIEDKNMFSAYGYKNRMLFFFCCWSIGGLRDSASGKVRVVSRGGFVRRFRHGWF